LNISSLTGAPNITSSRVRSADSLAVPSSARLGTSRATAAPDAASTTTPTAAATAAAPARALRGAAGGSPIGSGVARSSAIIVACR